MSISTAATRLKAVTTGLAVTGLAVTGLAAALAVGVLGQVGPSSAATLASTSPTSAPSAAPGAAAGSGRQGQGGAGAARVQRLCQHLPDAVQRTQRRQRLLAAGADTRGSLAWLRDQADQAERAGHPEIARLLRDRLRVRQDLGTLLGDRMTALNDAQQVCATTATTG